MQTQENITQQAEKAIIQNLKKCFNQYCNVLSIFMKETKILNYNSTIQKSNDKIKTVWNIIKVRNWQKNHK